MLNRIYRKISLEDYRSRLPGVIDSYLGEDLFIFNKESIKETEPYSNYGMFPVDVFYGETRISYPELIRQYNFFIEYYNKLTIKGELCDKKYNTVDDYISNEHNITDSLISELNEIQKKFNKYGGEDKFNWIKKNCFPRIEVADEYKDFFGAEFLWYTEAVKKLNVLNHLSDKIGASKDDLERCCLEKRYDGNAHKWLEAKIKDVDFENVENKNTEHQAYISFPLYLSNTIDDMGQYEHMSDNWDSGFDYRNEKYDKKGDNGTVVLFDGDDYSVIEGEKGYVYSDLYKEIYFGKYDALTSDEQKWWDESNIKDNKNQYRRYFYEYVKQHADEFCRNQDAESYAYIGNDIKYFKKDDNPYDLLFDEYAIENNEGRGFIVLNNGALVKPNGYDYVCFGDVVDCYHVKYIDTNSDRYPYIELNGKKKFAIFNEKEHKYMFYSDKSNNFCDVIKNGENKGYEIKHGENFIEKNGRLFEVKNGAVKLLDGITYKLIDGYAVIDSKKIYITKADGIVNLYIEGDEIKFKKNETIYGSRTEGTPTKQGRYYLIEENDGCISKLKTYNYYTLYSTKVISGYTESKLSSLVNYTSVYDDIGNKLNGCYRKDKDGNIINPIIFQQNNKDKYNDVGNFMDLEYKPGTVTNIELVETTENKKIFWGNFLEKMVFFYDDSYGKKIESTVFSVTQTEDFKFCCKDIKHDNVVDFIFDSKKAKDEYVKNIDKQELIKKHGYINENIKCEIIYYIGAIIEQGYKFSDGKYEFEKFNLSNYENSYGVEYTDVVTFVSETQEFFINETQAPYIINYFKMEVETIPFEFTDYNGVWSEVQKSKFKAPLNLFMFKKDNGKYIYDKCTFENDKYLSKDNGLNAAPVFRREFDFGVATRQDVKEDVYVDRGISQAIDKHLKLLEVNSLEALEQYSNGFFKINQN